MTKIELLRGLLHDQRIEVKHSVAERCGALLKVAQEGRAESLSLKIGMDSHAGDFPAIVCRVLQTSHGHDLPLVFANHEFPAAVEKGGFDVMEVREIRLRCGDPSDVAGQLMKCPDRLEVRRLASSQNKR